MKWYMPTLWDIAFLLSSLVIGGFLIASILLTIEWFQDIRNERDDDGRSDNQP